MKTKDLITICDLLEENLTEFDELQTDDGRWLDVHEAFEKDSNEQRWDSGCWIRYKMFERIVDRQPSAQPVITLEQVNKYCNENGFVVLPIDQYKWMKSLKSKAEEFRWNGGGNY